MKTNLNLIIGIGFLVLASLACNASFTTANLSDLKFGKNENASPASDSFKPNDKIYIVSAVNNTSDKHKVRFRLLFDEVKGAKSGELAYNAEKELEVSGASSVYFNVALPNGFVPGRYKAEAVLLDADGKKELDRKEGTFTVTGGTAKTNKSEKKPSAETEDEPASTTEDDSSEATRKTDSTSAR